MRVRAAEPAHRRLRAGRGCLVFALQIERKDREFWPGRVGRTRRVLVCAATEACAALASQLSAAGYEALCADADSADSAASEFKPQVVIVEAHGGWSRLVWKLRDEAATAASPLVVITDGADGAARGVAREFAADDCFPVSTAPREVLARLDALFWRVEVGRDLAPVRTGTMARELHAEIDDFLELLAAARAGIDSGTPCVLALVAPEAREVSADAADKLRAARDFFNLNLRRSERIAFYGPDLLIAHLPRASPREARADFARLLSEFTRERAATRLAVGFASSPEDGREIEELIERAEVALEDSRRAHTPREETDDQTTADAARDAGEALPQTTRARVLPADPSWGRALRESRSASGYESRASSGESAWRADAGTVLEYSASEAAARERERRSSGALMPRRVLLTVSDPARMAQVNLLLRSAGYEVRAAFDGEQALALLRIERADLFVLDYALQSIDGLEVLRRLHERHQGRLPMPVLVLLPPSGERVREEARRLGASGFVELPYEPTELLVSVRETGSKG